MESKISIVENALKESFEKPIREQLNNETSYAFKLIERKPEVGVEEFYFPIEFDRTGQTKLALRGRARIANIAIPICIPCELLAASWNDSRALADLIGNKVKQAVEDGKIALQRNFNAGISSFPDDSEFMQGLTSLNEILDVDNTIYGIDRATNKWYNPQFYDKSVSGAVQPLSSLWIDQAIKDAQGRAGGKIDVIVCNFGAARAYEEEVRKSGHNIEIYEADDGRRLLAHRGIPISYEPYFAKNTMGLLDTSTLALHQLADWDWVRGAQDAILHMHSKCVRTDRLSFWAAIVLYGNIACNKSAANAVIKGIEEVR